MLVDDKRPHSLSRQPTLKATLKCKNHPSIRIVKSISRLFSSFNFSHVDKNAVLKEIRKLNMNKAVQNVDIPIKILKENAEYFAEYTYLQLNEAICPKLKCKIKISSIFQIC